MSSTPFSPMRRHLPATSVAAGVSAMLCSPSFLGNDKGTPAHGCS